MSNRLNFRLLITDEVFLKSSEMLADGFLRTFVRSKLNIRILQYI